MKKLIKIWRWLTCWNHQWSDWRWDEVWHQEYLQGAPDFPCYRNCIYCDKEDVAWFSERE